ncbi:hypothetical protein FSP39_006126 [Pinctada imbricata]|uniref:Uncharacterized protein n=1 Tax=Pinctada imbricata TaxID=66713 RepID=A0AA88Y2K1_PINIB|nr:hypothetical protein FSP39_006126 [Pinctada imbricata]
MISTGASPLIDEIEKFKHSLNIGDRLKDIANEELDNAGSDITLNGFILGAGERNVTWYLMHTAHVPTNLCSNDPECLSTIETYGGLVSFGKVSYMEGTVYYICSYSKSVSIVRELHTVNLPEMTLCSDGVLIDSTPPSMGTVLLHTETPGYLSSNALAFSWEGFDDSHKYKDLGYPSPIAHYEYGVGTYPEYDDTVQFRTAGLSNGMVLHNVTFRPGFTYYVTLKAADHNGNSIQSVSEQFIYDTTPPEIDNVLVGTARVHQYFQSGKSIQIHISDLHDGESGIKNILAGIGTTMNTTDAVELKEIDGQFEEIDTNGNLVDGHLYFVIVDVENHAGLSSRAVSDYFIYDSSPPHGGIVRDGSNDSMDATFVANSSSLTCHWGEFYDHDSKMKSYSVALSTEDGPSDRYDFTYVGLILACNKAGLCVIKSSNGVIIDSSKPVVGRVHVGMTSKHSNFISSQSYVEAQWFGFEDPQSGIQHYDVCIGKQSGMCDIVAYRDTLKNTYYTFSNLSLPVNTPLVIRVKAINNAGLSAGEQLRDLQS